MKIKVGKRYRVKEWEEMVEQYGYDEVEKHINTPACFTDGMRKYCGKVITIVKEGMFFEARDNVYYWDPCMLKPLGLISVLLEERGAEW